MSDDPATDAGHNSRDRRVELRRRRITAAGHRGDAELARRGLADPDPRVRAAALGALARLGDLHSDDVVCALDDASAEVRRRAVDSAVVVRGPGSRSALPAAVVRALHDPDPLVVAAAAWYLAERRHRDAVVPLAGLATTHPDVRCREAAVAALGAIGDTAGLPAVLAALDDKATVRRRATVALAGFDDDPRIESALHRSAEDRDWQVRQAAEELLGEDGAPGDGHAPDGDPVSRPG